jgi:hypothetical protein
MVLLGVLLVGLLVSLVGAALAFGVAGGAF